MEGLKKSFLVRGNNIVGFSDKNFSTTPIGTVLSFAGQTAPHGYLLCDGASYKVADYPDLYAVIGNTYGGDTENFNVPNLIDKFIQGSTTSGEEKEAGLPNITGDFNVYTYPRGNGHGSFVRSTSNANSSADVIGSSDVPYSKFDFDASRSNSIYGKSNTVQPPALTMVYIIKAFHTNEGVDGSGSVLVEELWVNTNPTAVFNAQTVNIPNLSYYKLILFEIRYHTSSGFIETKTIVNIPQSTCINTNFFCGTKRDIEIKSNSIVFGSGFFYPVYAAGTGNTDNNYCYPIKIYGIK